MARKVFYSFHYNPDNWRASQVRNIGAIEGNQPAKDNDWETITKGGDKAIEKWIADQMSGRSCVVVLIGAGTANRKWINHEIASLSEKPDCHRVSTTVAPLDHVFGIRSSVCFPKALPRSR